MCLGVAVLALVVAGVVCAVVIIPIRATLASMERAAELNLDEAGRGWVGVVYKPATNISILPPPHPTHTCC